MRASYLEGSTGFDVFWCVAIVLVASSIVKIEFRNRKYLVTAHRPTHAVHRFCCSSRLFPLVSSRPEAE